MENREPNIRQEREGKSFQNTPRKFTTNHTRALSFTEGLAHLGVSGRVGGFWVQSLS